MNKRILTAKVIHKDTIYQVCYLESAKAVNIYPKGKRETITDFKIVKDSIRCVDDREKLIYKTITE